MWEGADTRTRVREYCDLWGIESTVLLDESGDYARLLGIRGVPTNVLVDSNGVIRALGVGNPDDLYAAVEVLIDGGGQDGCA